MVAKNYSSGSLMKLDLRLSAHEQAAYTTGLSTHSLGEGNLLFIFIVTLCYIGFVVMLCNLALVTNSNSRFLMVMYVKYTVICLQSAMSSCCG